MSKYENFSDICFYIYENEDRYINYARLNLQIDLEDVVWQVNSYLDKEKYSFDVTVSDFDNPCVIVNKFCKLPLDYCHHDLADAVNTNVNNKPVCIALSKR